MPVQWPGSVAMSGTSAAYQALRELIGMALVNRLVLNWGTHLRIHRPKGNPETKPMAGGGAFGISWLFCHSLALIPFCARERPAAHANVGRGTELPGMQPTSSLACIVPLISHHSRAPLHAGWPIAFRAEGEALGIRWPRGLLLHGPPGTGKTLAVHAVAAEYGAQVCGSCTRPGLTPDHSCTRSTGSVSCLSISR